MSEGETHSTRSKSNTNLSKLISQYSEKQNNNHRSSVNLTMDDINSDKFTPDVSMENNDFLLPEDLITVELVPRSIRGNFIRELVFRPTPPFLSMFYDEYSRHFLTINVGKNLPSQLELIKYGPNNHSQYRANHANNNYNKIDDGYCIGSNILNHYCPGYSAWYSSFRTLPEDNRHFLSPEAYTDTNLVVKVNKCLAKRPFEPLFGSIAIYAVVNDELSRISESFYFDATPESVRKQYPLAYGFADVANASQKYLSVSGSCINVGDGTGSNNHMNMFNIRISDDMKGRELYVIVQLSKILSIETEKALLPYTKNILPEIPKHIEACNRLINYRQPVGFGISRLGEKSGKFSTAGNKYINIPLYAQRSCISEAQFHSVISL